MNRNFERSLSLVLKWEGGFVNHPKDPGGATFRGITLATFRRYIKPNGTVNDLKRLTEAQIGECYRRQYWDAVKGDDLPDGVDYAVFDFGVNSGPARARKYLQKSVGVAQDGVLGPVTLAAVRKADAVELIETLCGHRMAFLKRLGTWPTFGKGWTNRVNDVTFQAIGMAGSAPTGAQEPLPSPSTPETHETAPAGKQGGFLALLIRILRLIIKALGT